MGVSDAVVDAGCGCAVSWFRIADASVMRHSLAETPNALDQDCGESGRSYPVAAGRSIGCLNIKQRKDFTADHAPAFAGVMFLNLGFRLWPCRTTRHGESVGLSARPGNMYSV